MLGVLAVAAAVGDWMPEPPPQNNPSAIAERYVHDILAGRTSRAMDLTCPHLRISRPVSEAALRQAAAEAQSMFGEATHVAAKSVDQHPSTARVIVNVQLGNLLGQASEYPVDLVKESGQWKVDGLGCGRKSGCQDSSQTPPEYEPVAMGRHYAGTITDNEEKPPRVIQVLIAVTSRSQSEVTIEEITPSHTDPWTGTYEPGTHTLAMRADPADFFDLHYDNDRWTGRLRLVKGRLPNGEREYASFPVELSTP